MASPELRHYEAEVRREEAAAILARRQWRKMEPDDLELAWSRIARRLFLIVSSAQLGAATAGAAYVAESVDVDPDARVNPNRWSGVASDGRPLDSLLYSAIVRTRSHLGAGAGIGEAMTAGGDWLDALVRTQVADADRGAAGVAIASRPQVGYVRAVSTPCCQRCAVLAGKFFKYNQGFLRHPKCRCRHQPTREGEIHHSAGIESAQIRDLTIAQRKAISDGADVNQVINAKRGQMRGGMTTSEGVTRRGVAGGRLHGKRRLTPEAIYRISSTREEAVNRLRDNGYLF